MKKQLLLVCFFLFSFLQTSLAQLPDGSTAPDFTLTDLNGVSHTLYDYLDAGKSVILEFSATWCGPCWNYHNTHRLRDMYNSYGPPGTDQIMVFFVEADPTTNVDCLYGLPTCVGGTQGNWVQGNPFPFLDDGTGAVSGSFQISYYPTLYMVCPDKKIYEVGQPTLTGWENWVESCALASTYTLSNQLCYGDNNGAIDQSVTGGRPSITFNWNTGQITEDLTNLVPGTYSCTITEGQGHTVETGPFVITGPSQPLTLVNTGLTHLNCAGDNNGSVSVDASGGTPGYSYSWSNGTSGPALVNIPGGTYTVTVTDSNGCTETATYTVNEPAPLILNLVMVPEACSNGNGSLIAAGNGGTTPYYYDIGDGTGPTANPVFSGLSAGTYTITITDGNGCTDLQSSTVTNIPAPVADAGTAQSINCDQPSAQLDGTGSTTGNNITYQWTTTDGHITSGANTATPTVNAGGSYTLTVTNSNTGCQDTATVAVTSNIQYPAVDPGAAPEINCDHPSVDLDGLGSDQGPGFVTHWTTANGHIVTGDSTLTPTVDSAGTYVLTITNTGNGCVADSSVMVSRDVAEPAVSIADPEEINCLHASIQLDASGSSQGPDFVTHWTTTDGNIVSGDSTLMPTVDAGGTYDLQIINTENGCINNSGITVTVDSLPPTADAGEDEELDCTGNLLELDGTNSSQGANFTHSWTTTDGHITSGDSTLTPEVDSAGTYTLTVTNQDNGCVAEDQVTVTNPTPITVTLNSSTDVDCNGNNSGAANVSGSGGTGNYSFAWSNGDSGAAADSLGGGTYTVTVTDDNSCSSTLNVTIQEPAALLANASTTAETAPGANDGTAMATPAGGTGPYTIVWSTGDTSANISGLAPGNYTVTVTDDNYCQNIQTVTVAAFGCTLSGNSSHTDASCHGGADGSATAIPISGTAPYSFLWSTGDTAATTEGLGAGTYDVSITDANNCVFNLVVTIGQPPILLPNASSTNETSYNANDGTATAQPSGGVAPYTYLWNTGDTTLQINGLAPGFYTVSITDAHGCLEEATIEVEAFNCAIAANLEVTNISCFGEDDGAASVDVVSGNGPFTFGWSTGSTDTTETDLAPGEYDVTVTDADGCPAVLSFSILEPEPLILTATHQVDVRCFGGSDAFAEVAAEGGTGSYSYNWPSGNSGPSEDSLSVGTYQITATDENGCMTDLEVQISEPDELILAVESQTDVKCHGNKTGRATVQATGGTTAYTFEWSNGATGKTAGGLSAGAYTVTVSDAHQCTDEIQVDISEPDSIGITVLEQVHVECPGDNIGLLSVEAFGGVGSFTYLWSTGDTTPTAHNLSSGTYTVKVTDSDQCFENFTLQIEDQDEEAPLAVAQDITIYLDADGAASIVPAQVNDGSSDNCGIAGLSLDQTVFSCDQLGANAVSLTVRDASGNESTATATVTVIDAIPPTLDCPEDIMTMDCDGPVEYRMPKVYDNCDIGDPELQTGLPSGSTFPEGITNVSFAFTDRSENTGTCQFTVEVVNSLETESRIDEPACFGENNGIATVIASGGTPDYYFEWDNGATEATASALSAGDHEVTITDAEGCALQLSVNVPENPEIILKVEEIIDEVNAGQNGAISIQVNGGTGPYNFEWYLGGELVSTEEDPTGLAAGDYRVVISDSEGCVLESSVITVGNVTAVYDPQLKNLISLYPNPTSGALTLSYKGSTTASLQLVIYDINGRMVKSRHFEAGPASVFRLNIGELSPGVYPAGIIVNDKMIREKIMVIR